ncbi:MAG: hypothetical protein LAO79_21840, partial [Acidobacteriia bacterium]|nr:hypothetical protein [Terriglobia bacterium]
VACVAALGWTEWWCWQFFDPVAPVAVLYFLGSCFFLGRCFVRRYALLAGLAVWIFALSIAVHFPVNRPWVCAVAFAIPYAGAIRWRPSWTAPGGRWGWALLVYVMAMHWLVALKPEVSSDGLAMHLAIPEMIARAGKFPFDFQHYAWSLMPMGGDFAFSAVYLLGGEMAARLLNFAVLAAIVVMVYRGARLWLSQDRAALAAALFASTPVVQLVTGSLFVENIWAAFVVGGVLAMWEGEVVAAGVLLGAAFATKVGTSAFLAAAVLAWGVGRWMEKAGRWTEKERPAGLTTGLPAWLPAPHFAAIGLFVVFAAPPYWYAWIKTGNPIFPFANNVFHSPYFDSAAALKDGRYQQPGTWDALYNVAFRSSRFIEGQNGALGFQYFLLLLPLLFLLNRKAPRVPILAGVAGAIVTFASLPNLRYLYPAMPLVSIGLAWMIAEIPWLAWGAAAMVALNLWFLPAAGWYHNDFAAFDGERLKAYLNFAAPQRKLIDAANRIAPGQPIAIFQSASIAGLQAEAYLDTWHTYRFYRGLIDAPDAAHIAEMCRGLGIRYVMTPIPPQTDSVIVGQFLETWTAPTAQQSGRYQIRSLLAEPVAKPRTVEPAPAGSYEDLDARIEYTGSWLHDHQFYQSSGGSITYSNTPGDRAVFFFNGRSIGYVYTKAFNRGKVEVSIDRVSRGVIDLFSKDVQWQQQSVFGGLDPGPHTLELRVVDKKYVDVDRLIVK